MSIFWDIQSFHKLFKFFKLWLITNFLLNSLNLFFRIIFKQISLLWIIYVRLVSVFYDHYVLYFVSWKIFCKLIKFLIGFWDVSIHQNCERIMIARVFLSESRIAIVWEIRKHFIEVKKRIAKSKNINFWSVSF